MLKKQQLQTLIGAWGTARELTSPSSSLLTNEPDVRARLEKFSLLSSRREYWDCAVCALGLADAKSTTVEAVLADATANVGAGAEGGANEFLNYSKDLSSVGADALLVSAAVISHVIGVAALDRRIMMDFETCYDLCGDNDSCLDDCLAGKVRSYE